jgi:hypothetical protein
MAMSTVLLLQITPKDVVFLTCCKQHFYLRS